jgi:hypothetical protein
VYKSFAKSKETKASLNFLASFLISSIVLPLLLFFNEEFIVNYKAYKTFLEYKKTFELERKLNNQDNQESSHESVEEDSSKIEKTEEKNETLLN